MPVIDVNASGVVASKKIQILIVEDEYVIAANLQENLETLGYGVSAIASSAAEAIAKASTLRPDLVLMDIQLQGDMDGIQAAEQIWNGLQIPVIYVTGYSDKSTLERSKLTFPFGYILKPVKGKELYVAIETALTRYEREQLLATILRSIGDGMIVTDTQGHVLFLNRAAELLTGWQQSDARGRVLTDIFKVVYEDTHRPIDNVAVTAIQQDTIIFLNEPMLLTTKEGIVLPITDSVAPIQNQKGFITGAVLIFRDDTQRRLQEENYRAHEQTQVLQRQNHELQRLDRLKDDFLSTVSHELRTPLTNIQMAIRMLEITLNEHSGLEAEASSPDPDRLNRYMDILRDQCNQELNLVNDLLELQQLQAAARPVNWVPIALDEWLSQGVVAFQERIRSRDQHLRVLVPPGLPTLVSDQEILTRILAELLTNACKYTPSNGSITVSIEVERQPETTERQRDETTHPSTVPVFRLTVCNSGVEISANELTRIFDRFYRIPTSDRWQQGGTGLGLALVKQSIAYLGGIVSAESDAGEIRFIAELPLLPPDTAATNS